MTTWLVDVDISMRLASLDGDTPALWGGSGTTAAGARKNVSCHLFAGAVPLVSAAGRTR